MKRPQNMTMRELIALPVLRDCDDDQVLNTASKGAPLYGGAFRDDSGHVWGTLRTPSGWTRYPAHLHLLRFGPGSLRSRRLASSGSA